MLTSGIGRSSLLISAVLFTALLFLSPAEAQGGNGAVLFWGYRRSVLDGNSTSLVLAEDRTRRKDPLNDLKYYTGGWNISDDHYIASVLYTGAPVFLVAGIWFVVFGLFLFLVSIYACCCRRRRYGYSRFAYALSLILLSLFTVAAIVGSIVLYTGQGKFHNSTKNTLDYVVGEADSTANSLRDVSSYLTSAKNIGVDQVSLPPDLLNNIDDVNNRVTSAATKLDDETEKNKDDILSYLDAVALILITVSAVMLALAFLGFLLSIFGLQCIVYTLVIFGWILIAATFVLCGIFIVLHNVMGDTCVAMDDWVNNPTAHTALDDVIPCVDTDDAQRALSQSQNVTFVVVQLVNGIISTVSNARSLPPPSVAPLISYNQSGPLVPLLCNPYNPDRTSRNCTDGEVHLSNATQVLKNYECQVSSDNICTTVGRLTPTMYGQMSSAINVSYGLNHYGPFLTDLVDCTFLRDTFSTIHSEHCPDLRRYSRFVFIGLAMVSTAVLLSLVFWVIYARERRHRNYTKHVDASSSF